MGKDIGPKFKKSRRAGVKLMLRGKTSASANSPFVKRPYPPGLHGPKGQKRLTQYAQQLMEKQKAKWIYGLREKQFKNYYQAAISTSGDTGEILMQLLEKRLDNVVYRLGLATTRRQARQLINHWHINVNGQKVDRPSYQIKPGDEVGIREKSKKLSLLKENVAAVKVENLPAWLTFDNSKLTGKIIRLPQTDEVERLFDLTAIVEFYSR